MEPRLQINLNFINFRSTTVENVVALEPFLTDFGNMCGTRLEFRVSLDVLEIRKIFSGLFLRCPFIGHLLDIVIHVLMRPLLAFSIVYVCAT